MRREESLSLKLSGRISKLSPSWIILEIIGLDIRSTGLVTIDETGVFSASRGYRSPFLSGGYLSPLGEILILFLWLGASSSSRCRIREVSFDYSTE